MPITESQTIHLFNVLYTRGTDKNRVPVFAFHETVVRDPTKSDFSHGEVMFIGYSLDFVDYFEIMFVPISLKMLDSPI